MAADRDLAARVAALGRIQSANSPTLSPDGRRVAYLSNASGSPQIWVRNVAGGEARQVTNLPDPVSSVYWSPTAESLAYTVAPGGGLNTQIWIVNVDGTSPKRLTPGGKENSALYGWTRDGKRLMADSNKDNPAARDPALINVTTGEWTMLASNKGLNSPVDVRGNRAVIGRLFGRGNTDGYLVDLSTGKERLLSSASGVGRD